MTRTKKTKDLSDYCLKLVRECPNLLVPHYLIHCYLYYVMDSPVISDEAFDEIARSLSDGWDSIDHPHKHLLDRDFLKSGFHIPRDHYPPITRGSAGSLMRLNDSKKIGSGGRRGGRLGTPK